MPLMMVSVVDAGGGGGAAARRNERLWRCCFVVRVCVCVKVFSMGGGSRRDGRTEESVFYIKTLQLIRFN